jgi:hypothetical protein
MLLKHRLFAGLVALMTCSVVLAGQGLADVAKAEEARRKTVKTKAKVYTNDDLKTGDATSEPAPTQAPAAPAPAAAAKPADATAKPDAAAKEDDPKKTEKYWRDRIKAAEQGVARGKVLLDALQSRVNALTTDFTNTDDPAQRAVVAQNRQTALGEMERVKADIEKQTKEIANIQEEARKANVPPGWLR